jgi:transposase-like protein
LSLRDLAELFLERGWEFTHEAVREGETRFAPLMTEQLRTKRRGQAGQSWYVDETYRHASMGSGATSIELLMRMAISLLRAGAEKRDREAAQRFDLRRLSPLLAMLQSV